MDCGNYIKRIGYCATISLWDKGYKEMMEKIERKIADGMENQGERYISVDG